MEALTKNSIHTAEISGYSSTGAGIARIGGKVVFVKGAISGETCVIKILKDTKTVAYARIEEILSPSRYRTEPECPVYEKCGGCQLMHMDYAEELNFKLARVQDAISRIGGIDLEVSSITGAEEICGYRNKAIFNVAQDSSGAYAGFYREHSHDVVRTECCKIQAEATSRAAAAVLSWMNAHGVPAYDESTHRGTIRRIFARHGFRSGETQVTIISATENIPAKAALIDEIISAVPGIRSIILNVNKTRGNTVLAGDFVTLWGDSYISDELCGLEFRLSPRSFYQINRAQAERLYNRAIELAALDSSSLALDLYCGTGTITLALAKKAGHVIGAEIVEAAIIDARENAQRNGITNAEFHCADASDIAKKLRNEGLRPDVIVVDPPRKGLAPDVITAAVDMAPARIVYVSCDPATLARDLKLFTEAGYQIAHAEAFDMFARTSHVETVCLMSRAKC